MVSAPIAMLKASDSANTPKEKDKMMKRTKRANIGSVEPFTVEQGF